MFDSFTGTRAASSKRGRIGQICSTVLSLMALAVLFIGLTPSWSLACACGCGVFAVATPSLLPMGAGGTVWTDWEYMRQYIDWHATTPASAGQNNDKKIETNFVNLGAQYMFDRSWGAMLEIPYWERNYKGAYVGNNDDIQSHDFNSIGDIRLYGMYTGLSEDMSTGLLLGFKVPSGDWHYPKVDRDTQIGTGSTNLLLGAYKTGSLPFTLMERTPSWYIQGLYDIPFLDQDHYFPGREFDGSVGVDYDFGNVGPLTELAPFLSMLGSDRTRDQGANADFKDSGYDRIIVAPGLETAYKVLRVYFDIELPIFRNMNGFQLVNPFATKLIVSYNF
ncbi:MAG: hypothetical protein ACLQBA_09765 [Candidatus Binataceae bacterium]